MQKTLGLLIYLLFFYTPAGNNSLGLFSNGERGSKRPAVQEFINSRPISSYESTFLSFPLRIGKSPTNEVVVINDGGTPTIFFINRPGNADKVMALRKGSIGWGEPEPAFALPGQAYYALQVVESENGNLICVFHLFAEGDQGYRGRQLDLWVNQRIDNTWGTPFKIFDGYVGAIRGLKKLKSGRLLLSFGKAVPEREVRPPKNEIDFGWNSIQTMYSDDGGLTWEASCDELEIEIDNSKVTRYGAIEPEIIEREDGSVWMLIRTTHGKLFQSISWDQGEAWTDPEPSDFISSDSPACLLRLKDGKMLIFWNSCQRWDKANSYAQGGRQILHGAISNDDGLTWEGYREVAQSPGLEVTRGDRGTAYSSAVEMENGNILLVTGQGEGKGMYEVDPDWFAEKTQKMEFGGSGQLDRINGIPVSERENIVAGINDPHPNSGGEMVVNFPMAAEGTLKLEMHPHQDFETMTMALTDHFSIPTDSLASRHAVFRIEVSGTAIERQFARNALVRFELKWEMVTQAHGKLEVKVNNHSIGTFKTKRSPDIGLNYLRIGMEGDEKPQRRIRSIAFEKNDE